MVCLCFKVVVVLCVFEHFMTLYAWSLILATFYWASSADILPANLVVIVLLAILT